MCCLNFVPGIFIKRVGGLKNISWLSADGGWVVLIKESADYHQRGVCKKLPILPSVDMWVSSKDRWEPKLTDTFDTDVLHIFVIFE